MAGISRGVQSTAFLTIADPYQMKLLSVHSPSTLRRLALTRLLLVFSLTGGCLAPAPVLTDTPGPASTATAVPSTPTPAWALPEADMRLKEVDEGLLLLGTLVNTTGGSISGIELKATLTDVAGLPVAEAMLQPVPSSLAAGESAGFASLFPRMDGQLSATVVVELFDDVTAADVRATLKILDVRPGRDGVMYVVGEAFNPTLSYARLDDILMLAGDPEQDAAATILIPGNQGLAPRTSVVFLAEVVGTVPEAGWQLFIEASPSGIPDSPNLVLSRPVAAKRTVQGRRYHVIQLQNQGSLARWIGGQLVLYDGEKLLSISALSSPFPLQPGETRVISVKEYPGLPAGMDMEAFDSLRPEVEIDALRSRPALERMVDLKAEVSQFEAIGDLIFIRGMLTNEGLQTVSKPSILIVSRDQAGLVLDSAWASPAASLPGGESVGFELTMLIPLGSSSEMSEYDILAQGMLAEVE